MSTELVIEPKLSLFQLETELGELLAYRESEELTEEERATADGLIKAYVEREVRKVDGVRAYLRHCEVMAGAAKEEARRQSDRGRIWQGRYDRLKQHVQVVMETFGLKRLEGNTGSLVVKGNGGRQPVTVTDPVLVPDEMCEFAGTIPGPVWRKALEESAWLRGFWNAGNLPTLMRTPRLSAIAEALAKPCEQCEGRIAVRDLCEVCGGSGHQGVPGARLEPRGAHLEVK